VSPAVLSLEPRNFAIPIPRTVSLAILPENSIPGCLQLWNIVPCCPALENSVLCCPQLWNSVLCCPQFGTSELC
jgi:hypothetical protein